MPTPFRRYCAKRTIGDAPASSGEHDILWKLKCNERVAYESCDKFFNVRGIAYG